MFEGFITQSSPESSGWNFSLALFKHAEENRPGFKALFGKRAGSVILNHLQKSMTTVLMEHFQIVFPKKKQYVPLDVFVEYLVSVFLGLLTWWLDTDGPQPAEQMNEYYRKLTEPTIQAMLAA
jgi:hypothetical protein